MTHHRVSPANRGNARKAMTDAELKLWNEVRADRLMGMAFRRQMPIADYIVDFACPSKKLIVELDGSQHSSPDVSASDAARTTKLEALGWTILRFWNDDVIRDIDNVCRHIVIVAGLAAAPAPPMEELVP
ncbi:endonuclease domain-containing protein [Mesorhizobium sp. B2-7-1]|uniref:endonuclease domain-containing protein n=1 Tax=Mesorhizobium sp. B2-7-1 TaxID=2589909 RepID=UPI00112A2AC2|nr:endonuclease domain-containing protein [Mesorhizobium sp. B2-7-1]TPJ49208.1 endonuclease domain-containing protein [Mesorhizobium sp. B2-7-1]